MKQGRRSFLRRMAAVACVPLVALGVVKTPVVKGGVEPRKGQFSKVWCPVVRAIIPTCRRFKAFNKRVNYAMRWSAHIDPCNTCPGRALQEMPNHCRGKCNRCRHSRMCWEVRVVTGTTRAELCRTARSELVRTKPA